MGFHKRYISVSILKNLEKQNINIKDFLLKSDGVICVDLLSFEIYELILSNKPYKHLLQ